jgi:hypothetical protein
LSPSTPFSNRCMISLHLSHPFFPISSTPTFSNGKKRDPKRQWP